MNRISLWYAKLDRKTRIAMICLGSVAAAVGVILIAYMALVPEKVLVKYGTVERDPIDGFVFSDDTQTIWVNPSEAANYRVTYVDKYSDEHLLLLQAKEEEKKKKEEALAKYPGLPAMSSVIPTQQITDMENMTANIEVMKDQVTYSLEMINQVDQMLASLTEFRNAVANMAVPPEMQPVISELVSGLDKYIAAGNLFMKALQTGDSNYVKQASDLITEANAIFINISTQYQEVWQEILNLLQNFNFTFQ
jgi:hypothetical protein